MPGLVSWLGRSSEVSPLQCKQAWKAVEDYRSPRRFAMSRARGVRQVLDCASLLALGLVSIRISGVGGVSWEDPR